MKINITYFILTSIIIASIIAFYYAGQTSSKDSNAVLTEFTDEPDDSENPLTQDEHDDMNEQYEDFMTQNQANMLTDNTDFNMNPQAYSYAYEAGAIRSGSPDQYADNVSIRDDLDEDSEQFRVERGGRRYPGWRPGRYPGRPGRRPWRPRYWRGTPYYYNPYNIYSYYYPGYNYQYIYTQPVMRYSVRITPKQATHSYNGRGFPKGYSIIGANGVGCGISGGEITLQRGVTYEFDIFTSRDCITGEPEDEPFFFTSSPSGGEGRSGEIFNVKPTVNGLLKITPDSSTPSMFFYNSSNHKYVGGIVRVV